MEYLRSRTRGAFLGNPFPTASCIGLVQWAASFGCGRVPLQRSSSCHNPCHARGVAVLVRLHAGPTCERARNRLDDEHAKCSVGSYGHNQLKQLPLARTQRPLPEPRAHSRERRTSTSRKSLHFIQVRSTAERVEQHSRLVGLNEFVRPEVLGYAARLSSVLVKTTSM